MSMRILLIMNRVPWPLKDGGSIGFYNAVKSMHDAGCHVTVAAMNTSRHFVKDIPQAWLDLADWHTCYIDTRLRPADAFLNLFTSESYHVQRFVSPAFEQMLTELLTTRTFDAIICEGVYAAPYHATIRKHTDAPLLLREHNIEYRIWELLAERARNPLKRWYLALLAKRLKAFETRVLNRFDLVIALTDEDRQTLVDVGCTKPIVTTPTGVDTKRLKPVDSHVERLSAFHLGSMEWMPNLEAMRWFLTNVWSVVNGRHPQLKLYVAGRGMSNAMLPSMPNVVQEGEVEDAVVFMQSKNIMIVPLLSGSGIRIKILEGMALGKPIVSTPMGAQGIACEHGKHLLIAATPAEFADAIDKLVSNPQFAGEMGRQARQLAVDVYDCAKVAEDVLDAIKKLRQSKN